MKPVQAVTDCYNFVLKSVFSLENKLTMFEDRSRTSEKGLGDMGPLDNALTEKGFWYKANEPSRIQVWSILDKI